MNSTWATILQYLVPTLGAAVISGLFALYGVHKTHAATKSADEAAKMTAQAAVQNAYTEASDAAEKRWARYLEAEQKRNERNEREIAKNSQATADLELRLLAAEERATNWEQLFRKAQVYLRKLGLWLDQRVPHEDYPKPPPELNVEL